MSEMTNSEPAVLAEADLEVINALQIGPRLPWAVLAEVLDRHPTSLAARWRRLEESGVAWLAGHRMGEPDEMTLSFHDVRCEPGRRRDVVEAIAEIPEIFTIEECYRDRDLMLTTGTLSQSALTHAVYPLLDEVPGLMRYESALCTRLHFSGGDWRLNALTADQQRALRSAAGARSGPGRASSHAPLPDTSWPIVRALGNDPRATAAQIAQDTGLHPATARRRLQGVLSSGAVSFRCEVAQRAAGYPVVCQWFARLPVAEHAVAAEVLHSLGALRLCASTTGRTNFTFLMWLRSAADIMDMEQAVSSQLPHLEIRESVIIANTPKRVGWHLTADGTRSGGYSMPDAAWG